MTAPACQRRDHFDHKRPNILFTTQALDINSVSDENSAMSMEELADAIAKAEKVTQKVPEALRPGAFQTVLQELLRRGRSGDMVTATASRRSSRKANSGTTGTGTNARLLALADEGVFGEQRSLSEIRQLLAERGFHYSPEELGTPLTRLVRGRRLRRVRVADGGKKTWRYSNY